MTHVNRATTLAALTLASFASACSQPLSQLGGFGCAQDGRCPEGFTCNTSFQCSPQLETCKAAADCAKPAGGAAAVCSAGACRLACKADSDCQGDTQCLLGACLTRCGTAAAGLGCSAQETCDSRVKVCVGLGVLPVDSVSASNTANSVGTIHLTWSSAPNAASYFVARSPDGAAFGALAQVHGTSYDDVLGTVGGGATYWYAITSVGADGQESTRSPPTKVTIPLKVSGLTANFVNNSSHHLAWTSTGARSYAIFSRVSGALWSLLGNVPSSATPSYDDLVGDATNTTEYAVAATDGTLVGPVSDSAPAAWLSSPVWNQSGQVGGMVGLSAKSPADWPASLTLDFEFLRGTTTLGANARGGVVDVAPSSPTSTYTVRGREQASKRVVTATSAPLTIPTTGTPTSALIAPLLSGASFDPVGNVSGSWGYYPQPAYALDASGSPQNSSLAIGDSRAMFLGGQTAFAGAFSWEWGRLDDARYPLPVLLVAEPSGALIVADPDYAGVVGAGTYSSSSNALNFTGLGLRPWASGDTATLFSFSQFNYLKAGFFTPPPVGATTLNVSTPGYVGATVAQSVLILVNQQVTGSPANYQNVSQMATFQLPPGTNSASATFQNAPSTSWLVDLRQSGFSALFGNRPATSEVSVLVSPSRPAANIPTYLRSGQVLTIFDTIFPASAADVAQQVSLNDPLDPTWTRLRRVTASFAVPSFTLPLASGCTAMTSANVQLIRDQKAFLPSDVIVARPVAPVVGLSVSSTRWSGAPIFGLTTGYAVKASWSPGTGTAPTYYVADLFDLSSSGCATNANRLVRVAVDPSSPSITFPPVQSQYVGVVIESVLAPAEIGVSHPVLIDSTLDSVSIGTPSAILKNF